MATEYDLCKQISKYLNFQYPKVLYHFDLTGLSLSKAQAGMTKAIQKRSGYPDLIITEPRGEYGALFIELKRENTRVLKRDGSPASDHIANQLDYIQALKDRGYCAAICVGWEESKSLIDKYLDA